MSPVRWQILRHRHLYFLLATLCLPILIFCIYYSRYILLYSVHFQIHAIGIPKLPFYSILGFCYHLLLLSLLTTQCYVVMNSGTVQELKEKLDAGYTLEVHLQEEGETANQKAPLSAPVEQQKSRVVDWVRSRWPHAELAETFATRLQFRIPKADVAKLSVAFATIDKRISSLLASHFSLIEM